MSIIAIAFAFMTLLLTWGFITEKTLSSPKRLLFISLMICILSAMDMALMEATPLLPASLLNRLGDSAERISIVKAFLNVVLATTSGGMLFMAFSQRARQLHIEGITSLRSDERTNERAIKLNTDLLQRTEGTEDPKEERARAFLSNEIAELEMEVEEIRKEIARRQCYN